MKKKFISVRGTRFGTVRALETGKPLKAFAINALKIKLKWVNCEITVLY